MTCNKPNTHSPPKIFHFDVDAGPGLTDGSPWKCTEVQSSVGCFREYNRRVTLTGASQDVELFFRDPFILKRIKLWFNDATAKSLTVDLYNGINNDYERLIALTTNTDINKEYSFGSEYVFLNPRRLHTNFSASTVGKIFNITVTTEELR